MLLLSYLMQYEVDLVCEQRMSDLGGPLPNHDPTFSLNIWAEIGVIHPSFFFFFLNFHLVFCSFLHSINMS